MKSLGLVLLFLVGIGSARAEGIGALDTVLDVNVGGDSGNPTFTLKNGSRTCCNATIPTTLDTFEILLTGTGLSWNEITNFTPLVDTGTPMAFSVGYTGGNFLRVLLSGVDDKDVFSFNAEINNGLGDYHTDLVKAYFGGLFHFSGGVTERFTIDNFGSPGPIVGDYEAVGPVPLPSTVPLFGTALVTLAAVLRRKTNRSWPAPKRGR